MTQGSTPAATGALLRVHSFAPAQSLATLASFAVHLIRPTHSILGVGFGIAVLIGNTIGSGILRNPPVKSPGRLPSTGPVPQRAQD